MTFLGGFFLVFVGVMIGYGLWYRDRKEEQQTQNHLVSEAKRAKTAFENLQAEKTQLEERLVRQRSQISILQQLCEDWSTSREQADRERAHLTVELEDRRKKCDEAAHEIQRFRQRQIQLEDEIHQLTRSHLEQQNALQQQTHLQQLSLESSNQQLKQQLEHAQSESERLTQSIQQAETENAELRSEIASHQMLLETATKNVSGLQQEYVSLESSLKQNHDQLKRVQSERATALSQKKQMEDKLNATQAQLQQTHHETESLRQQIRELQAAEQELKQIRGALADCQQQLDKVTAQRDAAIAAEQSLANSAGGLQTRLSNQESTIHKLRDKHRDAMTQLKQELEARQQLEMTHQEHCKSIEDRYKNQQQRLELESSQSTTQLLQQSNQLKQQLDQRVHQIELLKSERDNLLFELKQLRGQLRTEGDRQSTAEDLKQEHLKSFRTLQPASTAEDGDRLDSPQPSQRSALEPPASHQRPEQIIPFSLAMEQRKRENYDPEYQGSIERHALLGIVYTEEPQLRDDLKRISGIAEVLEAKLNDVGIYTYKQIVDWTPEAVEEFGRMLKFKDRIARDCWQDQARQLYQKKSSDDRQSA